MNQILEVSIGWRTHCVPVGCIVHFEAEGNYTRLYMADGKTTLVSKNLRHVAELFPAFWRLHRSYLVNPAFVAGRTVEGFLRLQSGAVLPIARRRSKSVLGLLKRNVI